MNRTMQITLVTLGLVAGMSGLARANVAPLATSVPRLAPGPQAPMTQDARRGRGADDPAGHTRRGRGADDAAGHAAIKSLPLIEEARRGRRADDAPNHG